MPSLYVHYKFGEDVLTKLPKNLKAKINSHKTLYHIFNQGNDNLYYYIFKLSYYRNLGIKFHHNKIDVFFANAFLYLKENPQVDSGIIYAFTGLLNMIAYQADTPILIALIMKMQLFIVVILSVIRKTDKMNLKKFLSLLVGIMSFLNN